jgi:hypothetical protein
MASRFKMARDTQSEKISSEADGDVNVIEEVSEKQEVSSLLLASCATPHRYCLQQPSSKRKGKRVAAEDFLDEETSKKTKSAGTGSTRTKKARKSTSKRSA